MTTHAEDVWLDYAWRVATCGPGHLDPCRNAGGDDPFVDSSVRYPGNLGSAYDDRLGVLCVSLVHKSRDPAQDEDDAERHRRFEPISTVISDWRLRGRSDSSDAEYLIESRAAYEAAIITWPTWWLQFKPILDDARLDHTQVAYTNLAKCRAVLDDEDGRSRSLARLCQSAFPIVDLVRSLDPKFVLVATTLGEDLSAADPAGPGRWVCWDGRNFKMGIEHATSWRPLVAGRIRTARSRLGE